MNKDNGPSAVSQHTPDSDETSQLSSVERRQALASLAKFAKYTGPGIALLLASEQAVASGGGGKDDGCTFCE